MSELVRRIREKDADSPFAGLNRILVNLVEPSETALVTLSELNSKDVVGLTMMESVNYLIKSTTRVDKTVLDVMKLSYLLYNVPKKRKRIKEIVAVLRGGLRGISAPVSMKPVKKILAGEEE